MAVKHIQVRSGTPAQNNMPNRLNKIESWKAGKDAKIAKKGAKIEKRYARKMDRATLLKTDSQKQMGETPIDPNSTADYQDPAFRARAMKVVENDNKARVGEWKARKVKKLEDKKAKVETRFQRKLSRTNY